MVSESFLLRMQAEDEVGLFRQSIWTLRESATANIELAEDYNICAKSLNKEPESQFWRRNTVRAFFALVELSAHLTRQITLLAFEVGEFSISRAEEILLREEQFFVSRTGKADSTRAKISTISYLMFTYKLFYSKFSTDLNFNTGEHSWESFRKAVKIRDRITHPRSVTDVTISDSEAEKIGNGANFIAQANLFVSDKMEQFITEFDMTIKNHLG